MFLHSHHLRNLSYYKVLKICRLKIDAIRHAPKSFLGFLLQLVDLERRQYNGYDEREIRQMKQKDYQLLGEIRKAAGRTQRLLVRTLLSTVSRRESPLYRLRAYPDRQKRELPQHAHLLLIPLLRGHSIPCTALDRAFQLARR
ncbi:MAG: hypothetical protein S4CHLAM2_09290 [Chlamydiales bacterium]|nr:hypothetical protein [Chlamydiales bacterium]